MFLHPPVTNDYSLAAGRPYAEAIRKMLCDSYDFSQEGVNKAKQRFKVKTGQMPFESWFLITQRESLFKWLLIPSPPSY